VQTQQRRMAGVAATSMRSMISQHVAVAVWTWLWQFGRGKPRLGGLTIEETSDRQDAACKASDKRRKETCEGSKGDGS
jgi:hypothetical protein